MALQKQDLMEIAGLIQLEIVDNDGTSESQRRVAIRVLRKIRAEYKNR